MTSRKLKPLRPAWWTAILLLTICSLVLLALSMFAGTFRSFVPVTLKSERAGLVMEPGAKVKLRGVQVGRVGAIESSPDQVSLQLEMNPEDLQWIPENVTAEIRATTAFGAKYVDLVYPRDPSTGRLSAHSVLQSSNVSTEVNTVFQNLRDLLQKVDPPKLNAVLAAISHGLRGRGERIGEATTDATEVLGALNARADTLRRDFRSLKDLSDTYGVAAQDIVKTLDAASVASVAIKDNASNLDALLASTIGLSDGGITLLAPAKDNLVEATNQLVPTTDLLMKYNPELTCLLVGASDYVNNSGALETSGANGKSLVLDVALLLGDDQYKYPEHLPIVGAKGGPGGKPGCGSLPDVAKNYPVRYLVTDTGWGTGNDMRVNPGIGFPGYANYFPVTRAVPEPPSIRNLFGGPAPGPIPPPGSPPYGAPQYGPDGTPLYPNLPPGVPGVPGEAGPPRPGSEPFQPAHPAQLVPTPQPPLSPVPPPLPPPVIAPQAAAPTGSGSGGQPLPAEAPVAP